MFVVTVNSKIDISRKKELVLFLSLYFTPPCFFLTKLAEKNLNYNPKTHVIRTNFETVEDSNYMNSTGTLLSAERSCARTLSKPQKK